MIWGSAGVSGAALDQGRWATPGDNTRGPGTNPSSSGNAFEFGNSGDSSQGSPTYAETSTLGIVGIAAITGSDSYLPSPGDAGLGVIPQGNSTGSVAGAVGSTPTALSFASADTGTGMGDFNQTLPVTVVIPADAYAGKYESTVTLAIVEGP